MTFSQKQYAKKRYHSDPEFRQRIIDATVNYQKNHRKEINKRQKERYHNRTPEEIQARKDYLRQLRMKRSLKNV